MDNILVTIRVILLVISLYGYAEYLHTEKQLKAEFIPAVMFGCIGSGMFIAGILNFMPAMTAAIFIVGIYFAVNYTRKKIFSKELINPGNISIILIFAVFLVFTYQSKFIHYDNFSHWGLVVRQIVFTDRFPNFNDMNIEFQSYPTGAAAFIYYFVKVIGLVDEWVYISVQLLLTIAMFTTLFAFCNRKNIFENLAAVITVFMMLMSNISVTETLLVDTLLSAIGLAGIFICFYYKDNIDDKKFILAPILIFLVSVKNSGMFFVLVILIYYFYCLYKNKQLNPTTGKKEILFALSPAVAFFLWDKHVDLVFDGGMTSKHAMSVENYTNIVKSKTIMDMIYTLAAFLRKVLSPGNKIWIILIVLAAIFFAVKKYGGANTEAIKEKIILIIGFYGIYQAGLGLMYIFSMPNGEAGAVASYERYHCTILTFIAGVLFVLLLEFFENIGAENNKKIITCLVQIVFMFAVLNPYFGMLKKAGYEGSLRHQIDNRIIESGIDISENKNYILCWHNSSDWYEIYMGKYALNANKFKYIVSEKFEDEIENLDEYDYVFVMDHSENLDKYLTEVFGSSQGIVFQIEK